MAAMLRADTPSITGVGRIEGDGMDEALELTHGTGTHAPLLMQLGRGAVPLPGSHTGRSQGGREGSFAAITVLGLGIKHS